MNKQYALLLITLFPLGAQAMEMRQPLSVHFKSLGGQKAVINVPEGSSLADAVSMYKNEMGITSNIGLLYNAQLINPNKWQNITITIPEDKAQWYTPRSRYPAAYPGQREEDPIVVRDMR